MGSFSVSARKADVTVKGQRSVEALITGAASYATGGDNCSHNVLGLKTITDAVVLTQSTSEATIPATPAGYELRIGTNSTPNSFKLGVWTSAGTEVANATNLTSKQFLVRFIGYA